MQQSDLYIEYARVIEMCNGTALESTPWCGVKFEGEVMFRHPAFDRTPKQYEFAIAILEDRPVFVGDEIYSKSGERFSWDKWETWQITDFGNTWTWQPPKPKRRIVLEETEYHNIPDGADQSLWHSIGNKWWRIVEDTGNQQ